MEKIKWWCLVVVGLIFGYLIRGAVIDKNSMINEVEVIGVIDGDTIVVGSNKVRVRLRQIDAPELEFCGGSEAKKLLESMISGNKVRIEEQIIDLQGRPMALVYSNDQLVNKEMVKLGWAKYHSDKTTKSNEIKLAAEEARTAKLGIFSDKCWQTENKDEPECNIKGNIDPNNSQIKIYQIPGCVQYETTIINLDRGERWFCNEEEAKAAGYKKSERCLL